MSDDWDDYIPFEGSRRREMTEEEKKALVERMREAFKKVRK